MARSGSRAGYETLAAELKKGVVHPAYLLWGEESFLTTRAEGEIVRVALDGDTDAFNLSRYDAFSSSVSEALASANELPMMKPRRVVVFRGITQRDAQGGAKVPVRKGEREALKAYLASPNPTTVLVLTGAVADQRQRFLTGAPGLRVYEMNAPSPQRLLRWIAGKATSCGFSMKPDAAVELAERLGTSMTALSVEIEKLSLYVGEGASATPEDVAALAEGGTGTSVYEISDAIAREDPSAAIGALRRIVEAHADAETRVMSELRRSFGLWLRIRQALDDGASPASVGSQLHVPPFVVRKNLRGAQRHDARELVDLVGRVVDTERRLKLGGGGVVPELERLLLRVAMPAARAAI